MDYPNTDIKSMSEKTYESMNGFKNKSTSIYGQYDDFENNISRDFYNSESSK